MKKKLLIGTLGAALVFGGAFAVSATNNDDVSTTNKTKVEKTFLSTDEVEKIALQEVAGVVEEIELERESGKAVYEVDIEKDDIDYDLHIDAYSGEIYTIDRDDNDDDAITFQMGTKTVKTSFLKLMQLPLLKKQ